MERRRDVKTFKEREERDEKIFKEKRLREIDEREEMRRHLKRRD